MKNKIIACLVLLTIVIGCRKMLPKAPEKDSLLDGPVEGLTGEQTQRFLRGDVAFNDDVFTTETGLGSIFVATSCGSCHAGDGKGHPFTTLTRFGQIDSTGNQFMDQGGPQLQNRAVPGYLPEEIPAGATSSKFMPPANTGLGYLELVSDADILAMADPNDADGNGVSGVPNWIPMAPYLTPNNNSITQGGKYIHRFGKKAAAYNLLNQTANAYNQDMGITSVYAPKDVYTHMEIDPEVSTATVNDVVFYLQTLKAPIQRSQNNGDVVAGKNIFMQLGCESCHKQTLHTGYSPVAALSNTAFHPYTDLLLHDMGCGLDDGYTEGSAKTYEWKTPPLWGLGLCESSQGGKYFLLHDGRATSIEQAVLMHGGEAQNSNNAFQALSESEKKQLLRFLESL